MSYKEWANLHGRTFFPVVSRVVVRGVCLSLLMVCGCTSTVQMSPYAISRSGFSGTLYGGEQPIAGATVQLYAVGTTGDGSAATPLLATPATTSGTGAFTLGRYTCAPPSSQIYLMASGGNPGLPSSGTNPQAVEMAALGPCNAFNSAVAVEVNEVTTVAAVNALAPFMKSSIAIGSGSSDAQALANAFTTASKLANVATGTSPGLNAPGGDAVPSAKISTLANILSTCVNSNGGSAGDSSPCGLLFSLALSNSGEAPTDTAAALLNLANNPTQNVDAIFDLKPVDGSFQPELPTAPPDWKVGIAPTAAAPTFTPEPGSYSAPVAVTLADSDSAAEIYYTTDGTEPTTSSSPYTGAFTVSIKTTIKAVAAAAGLSSVVASATYTLPSDKIVFQTQPSSGLAGQAFSPNPSVAIENLNGAVDTSANGPVTVQIGSNPGGGTLSGTTTVSAVKGIATFPGLAISTQGDGYTLAVSSSGDSSVTSNAFNLTNSVTLSLPSIAPAAGVSATGSLTLSAPAPQGGLVATLQSSNPSIATVVPTLVTIPQGATNGTFEYTGVTPGSATLTVSLPGSPAVSAMAKIMPPASISVTPAKATLSALRTQSFAATVANNSNGAVTWTLSPAVGSISAAGLYTAPGTIATAQTVTVTATSVASPTKSASASVSLTPAVSVSVTPDSVSLGASEKQNFAATVENSSNAAVTWSLSPAVGSISASGHYTAPRTIATAQTVTVTATSVADPTKSASASVSLPAVSVSVKPAVSVSVTPNSVSLGASQSQSFAATVANSSNHAVTWTVSPAVGSISTAGLYTAPGTIATAQTVTVTATSVATPTKSASASISLTPAVSVSLTPGSVSLGASQSQSFAATVANNSNGAVTWSLSPAVGSISAAGLYTAPGTITTAQTVTVTATSVAAPTKSASASISLTPAVSVSVTPATVTLGQSQIQAFAASVANSSNGAVTWSLSPAVGSISAAGLYTAPGTIATAQTVTVTATSVASPTKSASASISLTPAVSVSVTPGSVNLGQSQIQSFAASVANSSNTSVTWSLSPAVGSISAAGFYTAPAMIATAQTVTVTATSAADSTKFATVTLSLTPPISVSVTPGSVNLGQSQIQSFAASVANSSNTSVTWSLSPAVGSISAAGLYTAPGTMATAQTVTVTATSAADSTKFATATISLTPPISVSVTPGNSSLTAAQSIAFSAAVSNSSNSAVTWSVSPAVGTVSATGVYTAPTFNSVAQTVAVTAASAADPSKSATSNVSLIPTSTAKTYYLSSTGSETNSGTSPSSAWLTPNHPGLNCGDTIIAASGNYNAMTITTTPTCSKHDAVWVKCAIFDSCKINQAVYSQGGIDVQASYWAFLGWEVSSSAGPWASCFAAVPGNGSGSSIHDIYFINDIANGCMAGGFTTAPTGGASVDYFLAIADVVYNAAQGGTYCYSGLSVYEPVAADTNPGTHIYASQIFAWQNLEPPTCNGGQSTDGEGIIFDTFNGSQNSSLHPYAQQSAIENVITAYNGAFGILAGGGSGNSNAPMYVHNSTAYGNFINTNQNQSMCAQMASVGWPITSAGNANRYTTFTNNIAVSQSAQLSGCGNNTPYAYYFANIDSTDAFNGNLSYSASGQSIEYTGLTSGYVTGSNVTMNPLLANPVEPPAPSCSGNASVIDCMSTVIADFKPANPASVAYGYQPPSLTPDYDPLFPQWLCGNANMPSGLVTMGCLTQ
jgi:hypothetical protein